MFHKNKLLITIIFTLTASKAFSQSCGTVGQDLYAQLCLSCHGATGKGDGTEIRENLPPEMRARDFTTGQFKAAGCDTDIVAIIQNGGSQYGLNPLMTSHATIPDPSDTTNMRRITLTEFQLNCIVETIRKFSYP